MTIPAELEPLVRQLAYEHWADCEIQAKYLGAAYGHAHQNAVTARRFRDRAAALLEAVEQRRVAA